MSPRRGLVKKASDLPRAQLRQQRPPGAKSSYPAMGRINPVHTMLRTGTDAYSGVLDKRGIRAADDMVVMPLQCGNAVDAWAMSSTRTPCGTATTAARSLQRRAECGIEKTKNRMVDAACSLTYLARKGEVSGGRLCHHLAPILDQDSGDAGRGDETRRLRGRAHRSDGKPNSRRGAGTVTRAATRRAFPSRRSSGSSAPSLRRSPPTPGLRGAAETRRARINRPGTGSPSR